MTTKELLTSTALPRAMFANRPGPGGMMLRGPTVTFAPDDDEGGGATESGTEAGGEDNDTLQGGEGDDDLGGEETQSGDSTEGGGEGDDTLQGGAGADDLGGGDPPKKRVPWQTKRIDTLTAKNAQLAEEARVAKEEAAALRALQESGGGGGAAPSEEEINRRASAIASANDINRQVNALYDAQMAKDPKLAQRIVTVRAAVGDQLQARPDFFQAIISLDNGGDVFNTLTKDIDHLAEILEMPPITMGIELAKLSAKAGPKDPVISAAGARKPPKPIESAAATDLALDDPNLPQAEYSRRRAEEREQRRAAGG